MVMLLTCTRVVTVSNVQLVVLHEVSRASLSSPDKCWGSRSNQKQAFVGPYEVQSQYLLIGNEETQ